MLPLILNTNLLKRKSKIGYPQDTIWDRLYWEPAVITATLCQSANGKSSGFIYPSIKSWNNAGNISLPGRCVLKVPVFSNSTHITQSNINPQQNKTNHHQLNHPQTLYTHLRHVDPGRSEGKLSNPWGSKRKSWTHLPSLFHLIKTRKKKIKRYLAFIFIHPVCSFRSATPGTKRKTHLLGR